MRCTDAARSRGLRTRILPNVSEFTDEILIESKMANRNHKHERIHNIQVIVHNRMPLVCSITT